MGKNKLKKFSELAGMEFVHQYPFARLSEEGFPLRGGWRSRFFGNDNPVVLELGCGKGEYTVNLAERYPDKNYIGVDIKGARIWTGACMARDRGLKNVSFLRTDIELIPMFFAPGEVSEIWITFPDPQMQKVRKRLTSTRFMQLYRQILAPGGTVHLKTDSPFLYTYTRLMAEASALPVLADLADVHGADAGKNPVLDILTHYEKQWMERGLTIKYLSLALPQVGELVEPEVEIERDTYRSYSRGVVQCPDKCSVQVLEKAGIKKEQN